MRRFFLIVMIIYLIPACKQEAALKDHGPAKNFTLYDTDSTRYELADYKGKIVMIHFWADWCPNCRGEFPKIQAGYEKLPAEDFEILAVNSGQSRAHVREIRETYNLTYPLLVDKETATAKLYGVSGLPSTFFVNTHGIIVKKNVGWLEAEDIISTYDLIKERVAQEVRKD
jgi:peroxiredoxin